MSESLTYEWTKFCHKSSVKGIVWLPQVVTVSSKVDVFATGGDLKAHCRPSVQWNSCYTLMRNESSCSEVINSLHPTTASTSVTGSRGLKYASVTYINISEFWHRTGFFFYILLTMHPGTTLGKWPTWCTITLNNTFIIIPYFSIDNAHPKPFRHSFWCIYNAHDIFFDR